MSPLLAQATVAIEDRRFYSHDGVDYEGIVRAAVKNLQEGEIVQGGSTLTQQLVRNLYIGRDVSWERKTKEACLAIKLERRGLPKLWGATPAGLTPAELKRWRKDRILETYLNQVYFGAHAYGAEAAAQTYFAKHAADLELAEAALIAGLPQAPSIFDPFQNPEQALARRNDVLRGHAGRRLHQRVGLPGGARAAARARSGARSTRGSASRSSSATCASCSIEKYGATPVRSGGLKVYTTINPRYQRIAIESMKDGAQPAGRPGLRDRLDQPRERRHPGHDRGRPRARRRSSSTSRRRGGDSPAPRSRPSSSPRRSARASTRTTTRYLSAPFHWQPDPNSEPWDVATYSHSYIGAVPIATATLSSDNTVYARLTLDVGPGERRQGGASRWASRRSSCRSPSIGLGSNAVSVLEMASAYATLAAGGVYSKPMAIRKVVLADGSVDRGRRLGQSRSASASCPDGVAYEVTQILQNNITGGTGTGANYGDPAAAGKTGTTDNSADAWFAGLHAAGRPRSSGSAIPTPRSR